MFQQLLSTILQPTKVLQERILQQSRDQSRHILEITSSLARATLQANQAYIILNTAICVADVVEELFELPVDPLS